MPKCLVLSCENRYKIGGKYKFSRSKSFFAVPCAHKNLAKWETAKVWLDFCHIDIRDFTFAQHKSLCEDHFEPSQIEVIQQKVFPHGYHGWLPKRLKAGTVPTLLPPPGGPIVHDAVKPLELPKPLVPPKPAVPKQPKQKQPPPPPPTPSPPPPVEPEMTELECVPEEELQESRELCERLMNVQESTERADVSDLARWPPSILLPARDLYPMMTCGICFGYFYKATTITECLHTFCRSCLVQHFYKSLHCPTCEVLVHPSDPFSCIKSDSTMEDLVLKIFPERCQEESIREQAFYRSRGLEVPQAGSKDSDEMSTASGDETTRMVSVYLDYMGTSPHLSNHLLLSKCFLRVPESVTISQVQQFLGQKMKLGECSQAMFFVNLAMLHGALTLGRVGEIFGKQVMEHSKDVMVIQFGIVPKGNYFQQGIIMNTKDL